MSTMEMEEKIFDDEKNQDDQEKSQEKERGSWGSQFEFLFSCLSFCVGLGNVWRFPYLCYRNGGGAFLIPYVLNLFFIGLPLVFFELSLGQFSRSSPIALWSICPLFKGIGISMLVIVIGIGLYYNIIIAWIIFYLGSIISNIATGSSSLPWTTCHNWWNSMNCVEANNSLIDLNGDENLMNHLKTNPVEEFFNNNMLQISHGIDDIGGLRWELVGCVGAAWMLVYLGLVKGVASLGKVAYVTALFPYVILSVLLVRGITLPGAEQGIKFYLYPNFEKLMEIQVWADAAMQIFFSLGPCWGSLITLATYNKFNNNTLRDAIIISFANCLTSFLTGFVVFSFIGFMAHQMDRSIEEVTVSGPGLAFIVYPEALAMLPMSPLWAVLFFLMLLTLGIGTQLTIMETITRTIVDAMPGRVTHRLVLTLSCSCMLLAGMVMVTDGGMYVFQLMDNHVGTFPALLTGLMEILVIGWLYGTDRFLENIRRMIGWSGNSSWYRMHQMYWSIMWRLVTPLLLLAILVASVVGYNPTQYGQYVYPTWANILGWIISSISVIWIPVYILYIVLIRRQGISKLLHPTQEWRKREIDVNKR